MSKQISIVCPTFNQAQFLPETLDCFLAQTYQHWELIVVNDGSNDDTAKILEAYSKRDPRIKVIYKENGGTGSALNRGFEHANGEYETWFASDNIIYPNGLERLANYLDTNPDVEFVYANYNIKVMNETGTYPIKEHNVSYEVSQKWEPKRLDRHFFLGIHYLWRKELRKRSGEFQTLPCEDYDMILKMRDAGGRFAFLDENLGWFRRHRDNMTHKITKYAAKVYKDPHFYTHMVQQKSLDRRKIRYDMVTNDLVLGA